MSKKKWLLHPGWITSKTDGDQHFVGEMELIRLYGVRRDECLSVTASNLHAFDLESLIDLRPRYDGDYAEWIAARTKAFR